MRLAPSLPAITALALALSLPAIAQIPTAQYDNARTGAYLTETTLTPRNVNPQQFGKLFSLKVDADVYAQPLFIPNVQIPNKGRHDIVFISTERNTIYAFDAYGSPTTPLWQVNLLRPGESVVTPWDTSCDVIQPENGITSTPVIDPATGSIYVLTRSKNEHLLSPNQYHQYLHALDIATGAEKPHSPIEIQATIPGKGEGSRDGQLAFDPLRASARAALLLSNGVVYLSWGGFCDSRPYHGWLIGYDAHTLQQRTVFNTSPDADSGGIWASLGPAADRDGNIFVVTGQGRFDADNNAHDPAGRDYGDTVLKLHLNGDTLTPTDYFTPFNAAQLARYDTDLGTSGITLLPDQPGLHPHLAILGGKAPLIYVLDRDHLGGFRPDDNSHALQTIRTPSSIFGAIAYWNHNIYVLCLNDSLRDFELKDGQFTFNAASTFRFEDHFATPVISANGNKDAIVWLMRTRARHDPETPVVLYAVDATDITHTLYTSTQNPTRDRAGNALRFTAPSVFKGHVYVGARGEVDVYGLLPPSH
jgi:hypothetical protein